MALSQSALSELLEAFRTGDGVDRLTFGGNIIETGTKILLARRPERVGPHLLHRHRRRGPAVEHGRLLRDPGDRLRPDMGRRMPGNVFTFPAARHQGLGRRVVASATHNIKTSPVDVAALLCDPALQPFYEANGWEPAPASTTITADGETLSSLRMMICVSTEAAAAKTQMAGTSMLVPHPW